MIDASDANAGDATNANAVDGAGSGDSGDGAVGVGTVTGQVVYITGTNGSGPSGQASGTSTQTVGVSGARVQAQYFDTDSNTFANSATTTADGNGNYTLTNVPAMSTYVVVDNVPPQPGLGTLGLLPGELRTSIPVVANGSVAAPTITLSTRPPDNLSTEYTGRATCNICHSGPDIRTQAHYRALTNVLPTPDINAVYMGQNGGDGSKGGQPALINPILTGGARGGHHLWPESFSDIVDTGVVATNPNYDPNDPHVYDGMYTSASPDGAGQVEVYLCNLQGMDSTHTTPEYAMKFGGSSRSCSDGSVFDSTANPDPSVPMVHIATIYGGQGDRSTIDAKSNLQYGYFPKPNVGSFKQDYLALLSEVKAASSWSYVAPATGLQGGKSADRLVLPVEVLQSGDQVNGGPALSALQPTEQKFPGESWSQRTRTFSRTCAGCHNVGLQLAWDVATISTPFPIVRNGATTGQLTYAAITSYSYVDQKFGCEHCHGPGGAHATAAGCSEANGVWTCAGTPSAGYSTGILRPDYLTADGERQVCGKCHGYSKGTAGHIQDSYSHWVNQTYGFEFPWNSENAAAGLAGHGEFVAGVYDLPSYFDNLPTPGQPIVDDGTKSETAMAFWAGSTTTGKLFPQLHRNQYLEFSTAVHTHNNDTKVVCSDCHSAHGLTAKSQTPQWDGTSVNYSISAPGAAPALLHQSNAMCLNCHAGTGPFTNISLDDVATVALTECVQDLTKGVPSMFVGMTCGKMTKTLTDSSGNTVACDGQCPAQGYVCSAAKNGTCGWVWGGSATPCSSEVSTVGAACNLSSDCVGSQAGWSCSGGSMTFDGGSDTRAKTGSCMNPTHDSDCAAAGFNGCFNPSGGTATGLCYQYCTVDADCTAPQKCTNPSGGANAGNCFTPSAGPANIAAVVSQHMADQVSMQGDEVVYAPTATGLPVGRCATCHMAKTGRSGGYSTGTTSTGEATVVSGDIASHSFVTAIPLSKVAFNELGPTFQSGYYSQYTSASNASYNMFARMPSACGVCHDDQRKAALLLPASGANEYPAYWPLNGSESIIPDNDTTLTAP